MRVPWRYETNLLLPAKRHGGSVDGRTDKIMRFIFCYLITVYSKMTDYKMLYEQRSQEFDELNEQFLLYQGIRKTTQMKPTDSSTS